MKTTTLLLTAVFLLAASSLAAQDAPVQGGEKPRLAVVPFSGGEGDDGETLAELFSGSRDLAQAFRIYPRTSITFGINEERNVQKYVVSNEEYRNQLRALGINYVVAGDITKLGQQNLLVISIIDIGRLVQIAGDVQIFGNKREIEGKLPEMTRNIIDGAKIDWANKPKLAVVNPRLSDNADPAAANVLGEILGIEITRTGKYAVYPRNATLEAVQAEWNNQRRGATAAADPRGPGRADRPDQVLSVIARGGEGSVTAARFNASIIKLDTGEQGAFTSQTYRNIEDGITVMRNIAWELTATDTEREVRVAADARDAEARAAAAARAAWAAWWEERKEYAFRSYIDFMLCFSFPWENEVSGWEWDMIGFHWSFLPFTSIGFQGEYGVMGNLKENGYLIGGVTFNAGLVFPIAYSSRWDEFLVSLYGDGLLKINMAGPVPEGLLAERVTPGFDFGIAFVWESMVGFDIKYRGLWYKDRYLNAIGIGLTMWFPSLIWWK
jgi:TolB-like protein